MNQPKIKHSRYYSSQKPSKLSKRNATVHIFPPTRKLIQADFRYS
jgi:hypothetical protein